MYFNRKIMGNFDGKAKKLQNFPRKNGITIPKSFLSRFLNIILNGLPWMGVITNRIDILIKVHDSMFSS